MKIENKNRSIKNFYLKRVKSFIKFLKEYNNNEINKLLEPYDEKTIISPKTLKILTYEWNFFGKEITDILNSIFKHYKTSNLPYEDKVFSTTKEKLEYIKNNAPFINPFYVIMQQIGKIILNDKHIKNTEVLSFLYNKEIALVLGGELLEKFHQSYYREALQTNSYKELSKLYSFRYLTSPFKRKVAVSIYQILQNSKYTKKRLLEEWKFQSIPNTKKINYIKSLQLDLSKNEYINLLLLYIKLDLVPSVQFYIFNELYKKGELQKNIKLQKLAFKNNITSTHGYKYFHLLFENAKANNDIDTIKWMYSLYPKESTKCMGKKEVANFLNLPLCKD